MTSINAFAVSTPFGIHRYTVQQWEVLRPFVEGTQQDPKQFFYLADDIWELWPYALNGTSTLAGKYRAKFSNLYSFIKPFVKWYCYQQILQRPGDLREYQVKLSYNLKMSDEYLLNHEYITLDDLTFPVFEDLWVSLLPQKDTPFIQNDVRFQSATRAFWLQMHNMFGIPVFVPPVAPSRRLSPIQIGLDESFVIPDAVITQLLNKLALHREKIGLLKSIQSSTTMYPCSQYLSWTSDY